ncbi:MAG TPA: lipid II flippase MurJ, partial [Actinotalea sp.]
MRSSAVMAAGTAVSRVLGVVRISVLIIAIGQNAGPADSFASANTLPNMLYMLIAGGVLNAVLVPQVVRAYRRPDGQAFVDRLLSLGFALIGGLTVLLTVAAPLIVKMSVGGGDARYVALATTFAFWCLPQIFFYGTYSLLGQVLNARGSFGPYMWAPVVNNVVAIAGMGVFIAVNGAFRHDGPSSQFSWWDGSRVMLLAGSATLGVVAQAAVLLIPLYRSGFRFHPRRDWRGAGLGTAGRVAGWTFAALAAGQVGAFVVMKVTSGASQSSGYAAAGYNAYSISFIVFMLPHSLVTVSLLTAMFTRLSDHAARNDAAAVRSDFSYGLRAIGVFTVFATVVIAVLALPIARVISAGSRPEVVASLAPVIVALMVGLVALGVWSMCQRVSYAYEDARSLFWVQVAMAGVVVVGTFLSAVVLPPEHRTAGAGASISLSYVLGAVWGGFQVRARLGGGVGRILQVHVRAAAAALGAVAVGWPTSRLFGNLARVGTVTALLVCVVVGLLMLGVYLGLLRLMHVTEVSDLLSPLVARLSRSMGRRNTDGGSPQDARNGTLARRGGDLLDAVGRGTLLAGRYRLEDPRPSDLPGVTAWAARDQILDRPVRALILSGDRVNQAQDAARRAALVSDPRLLRVLDVGTHEGVPYTVTEPLSGHDLAELTANGPLSPDLARAVIGEAAVALEVARRRGVHHLALRPSTVRVTPDGRVVVSGLAMDGELAGQGLGDARSTTRADTVGLVALLYLCLTGHWPAPAGAQQGGTSAAPVLDGVVVPPAELRPGVPNDLDTLCAVTLGPHDDGPHSPAELVRELEPWGEIDAAAVAALVRPATGGAAAAGMSAGAGSTAGGRPATGWPAASPSGAGSAAAGPVPATPSVAQAAPAGASVRPGQPSQPFQPSEPPRPAVQRQSVLGNAGSTAGSPPGTPPPAIRPAFVRSDPRTGQVPPTPFGTPPAGATPTGTAPFGTPSVAQTPVAAASDRSAGGVTSRVPDARGGSSWGPDAQHPVRPPVIPPAGNPPPVGASTRDTGPAPVLHATSRAPAGPVRRAPDSFDTLIGGSEDTLTTRRFDPTKIVLALVAIALIIGLFVAWKALWAPIGSSLSGTPDASASTAATQPGDTSSATTAPSAPPA